MLHINVCGNIKYICEKNVLIFKLLTILKGCSHKSMAIILKVDKCERETKTMKICEGIAFKF